jgi:hypothetical protein
MNHSFKLVILKTKQFQFQNSIIWRDQKKTDTLYIVSVLEIS